MTQMDMNEIEKRRQRSVVGVLVKFECCCFEFVKCVVVARNGSGHSGVAIGNGWRVLYVVRSDKGSKLFSNFFNF